MKVINSELFLVPGNPHMLHLATVEHGLREFIAFLCWIDPPPISPATPTYVGHLYIEEVVLESKDFTKDVFANSKFIEDDSLAFDIAKTLEEQKLIDIMERTQEIHQPYYKDLRKKMLRIAKNTGKQNVFFCQ